MRRLFGLLPAFVFALSLAVPAMAQETAPPAEPSRAQEGQKPKNKEEKYKTKGMVPPAEPKPPAKPKVTRAETGVRPGEPAVPPAEVERAQEGQKPKNKEEKNKTKGMVPPAEPKPPAKPVVHPGEPKAPAPELYVPLREPNVPPAEAVVPPAEPDLAQEGQKPKNKEEKKKEDVPNVPPAGR